MAFMTRHTRTETIDVTDLADPDGNQYWIKVRPLTGDQWEEANAAQTEMSTQMSQATGKQARAELKRRKARRAAGLPAPEDEEENEMQTLIRINLRAYRAVVLNHAIVAWNLTDEYERPMPLDPTDRDAREASIRILPPDARDRIVDWAEAQKQDERSEEDEADFPGELPVSGADGPIGSPADPGAVAPGDLVVAHWADRRAGVGDLHPARTD